MLALTDENYHKTLGISNYRVLIRLSQLDERSGTSIGLIVGKLDFKNLN